MSEDRDDGGAPAPNPEERGFLRRLQSGEREALSPLIERYGEDLMRFLTSILRDRSEAEEAFQDTWVRVADRIHRCDPDRPFAPWLFRVARNRAYDRLRRRRRWSFFSLEGPSGRRQTEAHASESTPVEQVAARDLAAKLLPRLDPEQREIIWLRFYRECSYQEIAGICHLPLGTVKSRLRRALDRLATLYARLETPVVDPNHSEKRQDDQGDSGT